MPQQIKQALAHAPLHAEFEAAVAEAAALEGDVHQFDAQIGRVQAELAVRSSERNAISTVVVAIEQELAKRRAELDAEKQRSFDGQRDLNLAREELRRLEALRKGPAERGPRDGDRRELSHAPQQDGGQPRSPLSTVAAVDWPLCLSIRWSTG